MKQLNRNLRQILAFGLLGSMLLVTLMFLGFDTSDDHTFYTYDIANGSITKTDSYTNGILNGFGIYEFHGTLYRAFVEDVKSDNVFTFCFTNGPNFRLKDMIVDQVQDGEIAHLAKTRGLAAFVDSNGIINFLTVVTNDDGSQMIVRFNRDGTIMEIIDFTEYGFKIININAYDENSILLLIKDINHKIVRYDKASNFEVLTEFVISNPVDFHVTLENGSIDMIYLLQQNPNVLQSISSSGLMNLESNLDFKPYDLAYDGTNLVIHEKH